MSRISTFDVLILPGYRRLFAEKGQTIFDLAQEANIPLNADCGGQGICGKCRVHILEGKVSPLSEEEMTLLTREEIDEGIRLSCMTRILGPAKIQLPDRSKEVKHRILEEGHFVPLSPDPVIKKEYLKDLSDWQRAQSSVESIERSSRRTFSKENYLSILKNLPPHPGEKKLDTTLIINEEGIIGIEPGDTRDKCFGVAVDIGTTTVVASLIDLLSGREIGVASALNMQRMYGPDVLSRIQKSKELEGLPKLQECILRTVDELIGKFCPKHGIDRQKIYEMTIAGNPTMLHLFLGISPASIGKSPYLPVFRSGLTIKSREIGLNISSFGQVYCLPSVSGYVGADIVAGVIATGLYKLKMPVLFIDLGTNGEIVLSHNGRMVACSCAAGPAWEGMNLSCGMIASEGAIETVEFKNDSIKLRTIENRPPLGICGSGMIDAMAELLKSGLVDSSGRFRMEGNSTLTKGLSNKNDESRFILVEPSLSANGQEIFISQKDIRQVQLAKGAISSGIKVLLRETGLDWENISRISIAGAFGKHLRVESLERMGLIPEGAGYKVSFVGNTSKAGAVLCLLSSEKRKEAEEVSKYVRYLELSTYPEYEKLFIEELAFPGGVR